MKWVKKASSLKCKVLKHFKRKKRKNIDRLPTLMLACIVWIKNKISINHVVVIYWLKDKMWLSQKKKKKRLHDLLAIPSLKDLHGLYFQLKNHWTTILTPTASSLPLLMESLSKYYWACTHKYKHIDTSTLPYISFNVLSLFSETTL